VSPKYFNISISSIALVEYSPIADRPALLGIVGTSVAR